MKSYTEKVVPHPHLPVAFGFSNINLFPIISCVQSIVVPNKYNNDLPQTFILKSSNLIISSIFFGSSDIGSKLYLKPLQPPPHHSHHDRHVRINTTGD